MNISIGICAYNEEKNIRNLLNILIKQNLPIKEIIVVSDASNDKTEQIVKTIKDKRIKLIIQKKRKGKAAAINRFLKIATSPILILESGDNLPKEDTIENLVNHFSDPDVGIVGSHVCPENTKSNFEGFMGNFIYELHHHIAMQKPKFGELIAFRNVIKKIPNTAVDEESIAMLIQKQGYKLEYCPNAIVYNKMPTTIKDILKQRRRIYAGHLDLKKEHNYSASTLNNFKILWIVLKKINKDNFRYIFKSVFLEAIGRFLGIYDLYIKKNCHYIWDIAETTKDINPEVILKSRNFDLKNN